MKHTLVPHQLRERLDEVIATHRELFTEFARHYRFDEITWQIRLLELDGLWDTESGTEEGAEELEWQTLQLWEWLDSAALFGWFAELRELPGPVRRGEAFVSERPELFLPVASILAGVVEAARFEIPVDACDGLSRTLLKHQQVVAGRERVEKAGGPERLLRAARAWRKRG